MSLDIFLFLWCFHLFTALFGICVPEWRQYVWEEISRTELLCGVREMEICAIIGLVCRVWLGLCVVLELHCSGECSPWSLKDNGSVLGEVLTTKTKSHQTGDQKCLGFYSTGGSWGSASVNLMLQFSNWAAENYFGEWKGDKGDAFPFSVYWHL